jgi:MoaA/NifB/PqqE/SkfB family radical SAM enzyme
MRFHRVLRFILNALRTRFITHRPIFLSHMVTIRCDCKCLTCVYWKVGYQEELSTNEVGRMLDDAYSVGMTDYVVWGGEPLLRSDLPNLTKYANRLGFDVTIITNGSLLPKRVDEIAGDLYGLVVSIDHPDASKHDEMRGKAGVYRRAVEGVKRAKHYSHLNIFINCVVSKLNINELERMVKLAEQLDVKITFELVEVVPGYNEHLRPSNEEILKAFMNLVELKRNGHPIANSMAYLEGVAKQIPYVCYVPEVLVTVEWNGNIRVCSTISEKLKPRLKNAYLGNIKDTKFSEIFASEAYQEYIQAAKRCWKCNLSYPREISSLYSLDSNSIKNLFSKII